MNEISLRPQRPMPFAAAQDYEDTVIGWARADAKAPPADLLVSRDIAYGGDPLQTYDVFRRSGMRGAPVLVFWHGGGWTNGYKEYCWFMAEHITRMGMVLVAPDYRLAPEHPMPCGFEDALAALRHAISHAGDYGGDAGQIYLAGHSAGAHLATLVALRRDAAAQAGVDVQAIRACLPVSGIMDLQHPDPPPGSLEERVYTMVLARAVDDAVLSPLCWTTGNTVPMWLSHGERDSERVIRSNQRLAALLALQPGPVQLDVEAGLHHFSTNTCLRDPAAAWYRRLEKILSTSPAKARHETSH